MDRPDPRREKEAALLWRRPDMPHFDLRLGDVRDMDDDEVDWWLEKLADERKKYRHVVPLPTFAVKPRH